MSENHHQESFIFVWSKLLSDFELGFEYSRIESIGIGRVVVVVNDVDIRISSF